MLLRFFHVNGRLLQVGSVVWTGAEKKKGKKKMNDRKAVTKLNVSVNVLAFWCVFGDVEMKRKLNWVKVMADVYSVSIFCVLSVCRLYIKKMFFSKSNASNFYVFELLPLFHLRPALSHENSFSNFSDSFSVSAISLTHRAFPNTFLMLSSHEDYCEPLGSTFLELITIVIATFWWDSFAFVTFKKKGEKSKHFNDY